jgi:hypothetical protein
VPPQAPTPIFEQVVTSWFTEPVEPPLARPQVPAQAPPPAPVAKPKPQPEPQAKPEPKPEPKPVSEWATPAAEKARHAAESALEPAAPQLTDAGLPTRRPGAQLAPGAVVPRVREQDGGGFRDASAVRNSLSRHYQGMRAARRQTAPRTEESGKDEVDPR